MQAFQFLQGKLSYDGKIHSDVEFVQAWQLKDAALWKKFVQQFRERPDGKEGFWRGEFWGKMMRGACLTYAYTQDEELYGILQDAVLDLLSTQDELGRISTYTVETEFYGWDMWCRKYVLTGVLHFYDICREAGLKQKIIVAMQAHADAVLAKVGDGEGKVQITKTSTFWGCVNSCTILEPIMRLYTLTNAERYLDFAKYIISTGGCADGDLIETALQGEKLPHEYPAVKAYEMMSFFEGLLAYYEVTGERKYFEATEKFVDLVRKHEISIIGCAGCEHELFNHTVKTETEYSDVIMQETCVTVTWMRLLTRLLLLTGNVRYANALETPIYNAMPGSLNYRKEHGWTYWGERKPTDIFPFDSYSPLVNHKRGRGVGGYLEFSTGGSYGCCACIGAAGVALIPLTAFLQSKDGFAINELRAGRISAKTPLGKEVVFEAKSEYPVRGRYALNVSLDGEEAFTVRLRIPVWCKNATVRVGDTAYAAFSGEYCEISRAWKKGDSLTVEMDLACYSHVRNGKIALTRGPLTLCFDNKKQAGIDYQALALDKKKISYRVSKKTEEEQLRLVVTQEGRELIFTDYASCGKSWNDEDARISVWLPLK